MVGSKEESVGKHSFGNEVVKENVTAEDSIFDSITDALEDIKQGKPVIVVDDEDRENEGDLVVAAENITPETINFMATHARGLICMPINGERLDHLGLTSMVHHQAEGSCNFTISVDAKENVSTGISATDRYHTIKAMIDPSKIAKDFDRPGHLFPIRAKPGGVLERLGHTEASVDLAKICGFYPAAVICEIMNPDGTMSRVPQLVEFKKTHGLKLIKIEDIVAYRKQHEKLITREVDVDFPTKHGSFRLLGYTNMIDSHEHIALVKGDVTGKFDVPLRIHSQCFTGDVLGSLRCDCRDQLLSTMEQLSKEECGVLLYMRQEGRGIGLLNKLRAYELQDNGADTVEANEELGFDADMRDYSLSAQIIGDLGITSIRLITNNPSKIEGLEQYGVSVSGRISLEMQSNDHNHTYLEVKKKKMGHLLSGV